MGSSGGGSDRPPNTPAPPAGQISAPGQTAPFAPRYVNFLGDTNTPSTGLTPDMLAQINAQAAAPPPPPPQQPGMGMDQMRSMLAQLMKEQRPQRQMPQRGYERKLTAGASK